MAVQSTVRICLVLPYLKASIFLKGRDFLCVWFFLSSDWLWWGSIFPIFNSGKGWAGNFCLAPQNYIIGKRKRAIKKPFSCSFPFSSKGKLFKSKAALKATKQGLIILFSRRKFRIQLHYRRVFSFLESQSMEFNLTASTKKTLV